MAKKKAASASYTEDDIKSLDWREHIRLRPGMYIGKLGDGSSSDDGLYVLLKEVIDNSVDEFVMGFGKTIEIEIDETFVRVRDHGRGVPLGKLMDCAARINTGAKYDSAAFKKSVGLNGVGIKAVNALSNFFEIQSVRDKKTKSIVLSMHDSEEYILDAIEAKAMGYLLKDASKAEILKAIYAVNSGEKYFSGDISNIIVNNLLKKSSAKNASFHNENEAPKTHHNLTKREIEILQLVLLGRTNREISAELNKSKRTIETHRFNLMKKLNVKNLIELSAKAQQLNLI